MVEAVPFDLSNQRIRSTIPFSGDGTFRDLLELQGWDMVVWDDDFTGDAVDAKYGVATGVDGSHDKVAGAVNGESTIDVGDAATSADNEYGAVNLGLEWQGDLNAVMACRLKISNIADVKVECGFTDALADAGAVNVLATPTYTATDAALWIIDRDDTATWQGVGVKAGTGITKVEDATIVAPVNDTYQTLVVALRGDNTKYLQYNAAGRKVYESEWQPDGIEGGTNVTPWIMVQNRADAQDRVVTIDRLWVAQRRA